MAQNIQEMGVYTIGRVDDGGGPEGGGDVYPLPPKHYSPIYPNSSNIRAVSGGGVATGREGVPDMVAKGRIVLIGSIGGSKGDRGRGSEGRVLRWI